MEKVQKKDEIPSNVLPYKRKIVAIIRPIVKEGDDTFKKSNTILEPRL